MSERDLRDLLIVPPPSLLGEVLDTSSGAWVIVPYEDKSE